MGQPNRILVERCSKCYASPKAYKTEQSQSMLKLFSEYQIAFKQRPNQPVRPSLKPENIKEIRQRLEKENRDRIKTQMEKKSMYGMDYGPITNNKKTITKKQKSDFTHLVGIRDASTTYDVDFLEKGSESPMKKKAPKSKNPIQSDKSVPFNADSIYTACYKSYSNETMLTCRQCPVKAKDNIEIPTSTEWEKNAKSTAMDDFVRPPDKPRQEFSTQSIEPLQDSTEYKDSYDPSKRKTKKTTRSCAKDSAVSTAMHDFIWPTGFEQQRPCRPPISTHFISAKFDGTSTSSLAYKPFKVVPYELPKWAKKQKYKRPEGLMDLNSLYMFDFTDPETVQRPKPIQPKRDSGNPINEQVADISTGTTYYTDFKKWEGLSVPESYRTFEVYTPPKENMDFETNHRSDYKGEFSPKRTLCRHTSQHRDLNVYADSTFSTTYNETFQNPRPKTSLSVGVSSTYPGNMSRCSSPGTCNTKIPVPFPAEANNVNASAGTTSNAETTNILKIHPSTPVQISKRGAHVGVDGKDMVRSVSGSSLPNEE